MEHEILMFFIYDNIFTEVSSVDPQHIMILYLLRYAAGCSFNLQFQLHQFFFFFFFFLFPAKDLGRDEINTLKLQFFFQFRTIRNTRVWALLSC